MAEHTSEKTPERDQARDIEEFAKRDPAAETGENTSGHAERHSADHGEAHHSRKKKKAGRKSRGFPVGGLIFMLLLIVFIFAAVHFGLQYMSSFEQLRGEYDGAVQAAEAERDAARALYEEADPESDANSAERRQVTDEMIAEASAELEALRNQSEETESAIRAAEEKINALHGAEDEEYYRAIYDEYNEGRDFVEGLLSGD